MKFENIIVCLVLALTVLSCEDVIDVELEQGNNQLVVDAWVNNLPQQQVIYLTRAAPYFDNSPAPTELGATVSITEDNGKVYLFEDPDNNGSYTWDPPVGEPFGRIGGAYALSITTSTGVAYEAFSVMKNIMTIDSIQLEDREEELGQPAGIYAALFARDLPGEGDAYWIKTFKNGVFLNKPFEMNIAWDAAFTPGSGVDGVIFITPIRENINRLPDPDDAEDNDEVAPWAIGDTINVEIHSLNPDAFMFLEQAQTQMTLGNAGIFAEPPANVISNINNLNGSNPEDKPIGFFSVSAVATKGRKIEL